MRLAPFLPIFLLVCIQLNSQSSTVATPAPKDPQAVSILTQALAVAGGTAAVSATTDYTASGTIIYSQGPNVQESVRISGRGSDELRIDTNSSGGPSSYLINGPYATTKAARGDIEVQNIQSPMMSGNLILPYRELAQVLSNSQFSLTYDGIVQVDGRSVYEIKAQRGLVGRHPLPSFPTYHAIDFLIDSSNFQLYITRDILPRDAAPRQIRYSDYRAVSGVLVPFSIDQEIGGERTSLIHLDQISFNLGLQDSTFNLDGVAR